MCSMSAVSDYYMQTYPGRLGLSPYNQLNRPLGGIPAHTNPIQIVRDMDPEVKDMLRRALELLDRVDKKLGDIDCSDESKAAFLNALTPNET